MKSAQENFAEEASFLTHKMGHVCNVHLLHTIILGFLARWPSSSGLCCCISSSSPLGKFFNTMTKENNLWYGLWVPWSMSASVSPDPPSRDLHQVGVIPSRMGHSPSVIFALSCWPQSTVPTHSSEFCVACTHMNDVVLQKLYCKNTRLFHFQYCTFLTNISASPTVWWKRKIGMEDNPTSSCLQVQTPRIQSLSLQSMRW